MAKDIRILSDEFPFNAVVQIGGSKITTENMSLTADGRLIVQGKEGKQTLIASSPS